MILDYSYKFKNNSRSGIVSDAVGFNKYLELGDPNDPFYQEDFTGLPAIEIERKFKKPIQLIFNSSKERDEVFENLVKQVENQKGD